MLVRDWHNYYIKNIIYFFDKYLDLVMITNEYPFQQISKLSENRTQNLVQQKNEYFSLELFYIYNL